MSILHTEQGASVEGIKLVLDMEDIPYHDCSITTIKIMRYINAVNEVINKERTKQEKKANNKGDSFSWSN